MTTQKKTTKIKTKAEDLASHMLDQFSRNYNKITYNNIKYPSKSLSITFRKGSLPQPNVSQVARLSQLKSQCNEYYQLLDFLKGDAGVRGLMEANQTGVDDTSCSSSHSHEP